ncbi:NTP transferase domain-containing protein [Nocardioides sp. DS6]|uniref:NTP transferase domain-containing protein n=1 Tax=Nocardioides eburneus TaxID=3231482 RepID=A0ABV3SUP7_9ACTN
MTLHGLLLAAGAGRRMGRPKALVDDWLPRSVAVLRGGGCDDVTVVLGAAVEEARPLLPDDVRVVVAMDWATGMSASLRAGLDALAAQHHGAATGAADAALVHLVDLPDVGADVVGRVGRLAAPDALARASYDGVPGHPVLIGCDHWAGVVETLVGDQGAKGYLAAHGAALVECGDLAGGQDVDRR